MVDVRSVVSKTRLIRRDCFQPCAVNLSWRFSFLQFFKNLLHWRCLLIPLFKFYHLCLNQLENWTQYSASSVSFLRASGGADWLISRGGGADMYPDFYIKGRGHGVAQIKGFTRQGEGRRRRTEVIGEGLLAKKTPYRAKERTAPSLIESDYAPAVRDSSLCSQRLLNG